MIDPHFYKIGSPISLADLATQLGLALPVEGAGDEMINVPSALHNSLPGSLSFFSDKRRKDQLKTAQATACLTTEKLLPLVTETGMIALITDNPRAVFARLSGEMVTVGGSKARGSEVDETANIHPSTIMGENVRIGAGTKIGPHCVIDDGVVIGADCIIEPLVHISFSEIGDGCHIKSGAVIGGTGFGMAEDAKGVITVPHLGRVILGNGVHIGSNSCVDRGQLGDTILADDVKIDNMVQIGHNVRIGEGTMIAAHSGISGSCLIGKKCLFGGRASLADHIKVGDGAIIAAAAGIMADVPAGQMYSGIPAMPIREHMRNVATLKKLAKPK
jgi:UDP-3-O-[3-hydroxymyristoyl] glucosamine N-acyltransferase